MVNPSHSGSSSSSRNNTQQPWDLERADGGLSTGGRFEFTTGGGWKWWKLLDSHVGGSNVKGLGVPMLCEITLALPSWRSPGIGIPRLGWIVLDNYMSELLALGADAFAKTAHCFAHSKKCEIWPKKKVSGSLKIDASSPSCLDWTPLSAYCLQLLGKHTRINFAQGGGNPHQQSPP